ncbi:hypothetical protein Tco_0168134 [Tanacetum coccineum]
MAGSGTSNVIARRAINEIAEFSGETETPKYMKMEAMNDQDEYYDSLRCLRDRWRIREDKLMGLNKAIVAAEEEINTLETHLEMMDAAINFE